MSTERIPLSDKDLWQSLSTDRVPPAAVSEMDFAAWLEGRLSEVGRPSSCPPSREDLRRRTQLTKAPTTWMMPAIARICERKSVSQVSFGNHPPMSQDWNLTSQPAGPLWVKTQ